MTRCGTMGGLRITSGGEVEDKKRGEREGKERKKPGGGGKKRSLGYMGWEISGDIRMVE